jgi:beta-glucanase (GH16 family)
MPNGLTALSSWVAAALESTSLLRGGDVVIDKYRELARLSLLMAAGLSQYACGGGGGGGSPPATTPPPPQPPPAAVVNVNIDNPTLVRDSNLDVRPGEPSSWMLAWSDEFDATQLDPAVWFFESGDGSQYGIPGWGNNELQWYLEDSAEIRGGMLVITARAESVAGKNYTSARLNTRDRFAFRYGRIEARIRLPGGQGLWPAFWMLPQDDVYGTWAASGEIDIVEAVNLGGTGGNTVFGTIHYGGESPNNTLSTNDGGYEVSGDLTAQFHVFALEWDSTVPEMRWYVDETLYSVKNDWFTEEGAPFPAPFDQQFYILLNVAVGGNFPGPPNSSTVFPVEMEVDYVRVYSGTP